MPFKIPKQKPGYIGDWVLEDSKFVNRQPSIRRKKGNKSMIEAYQSERNDKNTLKLN